MKQAGNRSVSGASPLHARCRAPRRRRRHLSRACSRHRPYTRCVRKLLVLCVAALGGVLAAACSLLIEDGGAYVYGPAEGFPDASLARPAGAGGAPHAEASGDIAGAPSTSGTAGAAGGAPVLGGGSGDSGAALESLASDAGDLGSSAACAPARADGGERVLPQVPFDCRQNACEAGELVSVPDDSDVPPDDGVGCSFAVCSQGEPSLAYRLPGTPCGDAVTTSCSNADSCDGLGSCDPNHLSVGALVASPAGDCRASRCDGSGGVEVVADDADVPADPGGGCQRPTCSGGSLTAEARPAGTPCGAGDTACSQADQCNGSGACLLRHRPSGFVLSEATPGDCRARTCNGSGGVVVTPTDSACDDGQRCTGAEACSSLGVCSSSGNPCAADRPFCDEASCRQCTLDEQCPGLRGPGTGRCSGGGSCIECTDASVEVDCGGRETSCSGGRCRVTCDCSEEACNRTYSALCTRQ